MLIIPLNIQRFATSTGWDEAYEYDVSTDNNSNYVYAKVYVTTSGGTYNNYPNQAYCEVKAVSANNTYSSKKYFTIGKNSTVRLEYRFGPFNHNSDGTLGNITLTSTVDLATGSSSGKASSSKTISTTNIQRYAYFGDYYLSGTTESGTYFNWSSSDPVDKVQYKLDGGSWKDASGNKFWVSASSGSWHYVCARIRRTGTSNWWEGGDIEFSTYSYPYVTGSKNINVGDSNTVSFYNPLSRRCAVYILANGASDWKGGDETNGTSISGYDGESWRNYWYEACPNGTQNTYKVKVNNLTGGTSNETGYNYTYYIKEDYNNGEAKPTFGDFTCKDINEKTLSLTGDSSKVILGYSTIQATVPAANKSTANKYATMKSYKMVVGNHDPVLATYSSSSDVKMSISNVNSNSVAVYAVDSRGFTSGKTKNLTVVNYTTPVLNAVGAKATRSSNGIGEQVTLSFDGTFWNNNFGSVQNTIQNVTYKYKKTDEKDFNTPTDISNMVVYDGNKFSLLTLLKGDLENNGFDVSDSYNVIVEFEDELHKISFSLIIPSGSPNIALAKNGVAIMQKYDNDLGGALQVNGKIYSKGDEVQTINLAMMFTYNSDQYINSGDTQFVTGWGTSADISWGDIYCDPSNDRIVIPAGTAEYVKLSGQIAGNGGFWGYITVYDEDANAVDDASILFQPDNKSYVKTPVTPTIIKLNNPNKMHYVKMKINGYNSNFGVNYGFGKSGTFMMVEKVK